MKSPIAEKVFAAQPRQHLGCGPHSSIDPLPMKVMGIGNRTAVEATNTAVGSGVALITPIPGAPGKPWDAVALGSLKAKRGRGRKINCCAPLCVCFWGQGRLHVFHFPFAFRRCLLCLQEGTPLLPGVTPGVRGYKRAQDPASCCRACCWRGSISWLPSSPSGGHRGAAGAGSPRRAGTPQYPSASPVALC